MIRGFLRGIGILILLSSFLAKTFGQKAGHVTLDEVIANCHGSSLSAYKAKQKYGIGYWQFNSFKSSLRPTLNLSMRPFTFNRSFIKRYDPEHNIDVYRQQQNLNTLVLLSLSQNILSTGGVVYVNSQINRLMNFGSGRGLDYSSIPVSIGLQQPIFGFNKFKWDKKIFPKELDRSRKAFLYEMEELNLKSVTLFFNWLMAKNKLEIAEKNLTETKRLYEIGKRRFDLGSIERIDLLNLELECHNSEIYVKQDRQDVQLAITQLRLFVKMDSLEQLSPELPDMISGLTIEDSLATSLAEKNNPKVWEAKVKSLISSKDLDKVEKESRFDLALNVDLGLNQQSSTLKGVYQGLQNQQIVSIQFNLPILDWGVRKSNVRIAKFNNQVAEIEGVQEINEMKSALKAAVINFNMQSDLVRSAARVRSISRESYDLTERRFSTGSVDLLNLISARKYWQSSEELYIKSLQSYWEYYYTIQQITLFNFRDGIPVEGFYKEVPF